LVLRIVGSAAMLALLVWRLPDFDVSELVPEWSTTVALWLVASALTMLVAFALQTVRWSQVLTALGHHIEFRTLLNQFLSGQFVSNVLPTAFGGDVVRIARSSRIIGDRPAAFASIALERLTGWLVLPLISFTALAAVPEFRALGGVTVTAIAINGVTLAALLAILFVAASQRWTQAALTATGWRAWLASVHLGINAMRRSPGAIGRTVAAGVAFQVTQCLAVYFVARALDIGVITVWAVFAFFPPTAISQNLPVGFGGLGVREAGFVVFFGALGAVEERAIALGLITYLITVLTSALGAPSFAFGGWRTTLAADVATAAERS